jgi:hypothetical protein
MDSRAWVRILLIKHDDWRLRIGRGGLIIFGGTLLMRAAFGPQFHGGWLWLYLGLTAIFGSVFLAGLTGERRAPALSEGERRTQNP